MIIVFWILKIVLLLFVLFCFLTTLLLCVRQFFMIYGTEEQKDIFRKKGTKRNG